jgi:hypothetical protein
MAHSCKTSSVIETLKRIRTLVEAGQVKISAHGYHEMAEDGILATEVVAGLSGSVIVEDYPDYPKGPCVLVLEIDPSGNPIHALWGIPKGKSSPAVLITAYRPDPDRWSDDFTRRLPS